VSITYAEGLATSGLLYDDPIHVATEGYLFEEVLDIVVPETLAIDRPRRKRGSSGASRIASSVIVFARMRLPEDSEKIIRGLVEQTVWSNEQTIRVTGQLLREVNEPQLTVEVVETRVNGKASLLRSRRE
jgi:hypothetical protein